MNGNRTKYTYTPTYGMQKRSLMKKSAPVRQVPEAPDFTQVPDPAIGVPLQQMTQQPIQPMTPPQPQMPAPAQPGYLTGAQSMPLSAPTFVQPGSYTQLPPVQNMAQPVYQQLPLGNMASKPQQGSFSARSQGFVPPAQNSTPPMQQPGIAPQIGWTNPQAAQQPIPPFSGFSGQSGHSAQAAPQSPYQPQQAPYYPPLQPIPQQPAFTIQSNAPHAAPRTPAVDADKLWSLFLFGLLPLLFIPCLFVPASWDVLRYIFLGVSVIGLGAMWYRQMYTPSSRLIVSLVYVALCIATIAMLMQGANDAQQTAANMGQPQRQQVQETVTPTPDPALAAAAVPVTPTPAPTISGPSEAEKRLSMFMELWMVNNTTEMVNLVQPSWRGQQENPSTALFVALANRTPEDFTIEEISGTETDNSRTVTMRATINKNTGKAPVVYRFMVMMVKESGEWYVNPNSLATNDAQESADQEQNVVKTQSSGSVTEPPRETVTPAPPGSTLLYYNNGGNYYHMDPECPSVAKEYLPFDSSFTYYDLGQYNNSLLPCLNCNAPIDTLD